MFHRLPRPVSLLAAAILMTVWAMAPSMAEPVDCQRQLDLLRPDAPEARKLQALLTCATETRSDVAALTVRVRDLERAIGSDPDGAPWPTGRGLTGRIAELERTVGGQGRTLDTVDARIARTVTGEMRDLARVVARHDLTLEGLDDRIGRVVTEEVSDMARTVTQHERALEVFDTRLDRAVMSAARDVETVLRAEIDALRAEMGIGRTETGSLAPLGLRLDQLSGRRWQTFAGPDRAVGQRVANDRDYPIIVSATVSGGMAGRCEARLRVNGLTVAESAGGGDQTCFVTATVPPGALYVLDAGSGGETPPRVSTWAELR